jgi:hypothetical protein
MIEIMPSMCEAVDSIPAPKKKKTVGVFVDFLKVLILNYCS